MLLLGFAAVPGEWGLLPREVFGALFPMFLDNSSPSSGAVLRSIWAVNQGLMLEILVEYYSQDQAHISRVLDICMDLQVGVAIGVITMQRGAESGLLQFSM